MIVSKHKWTKCLIYNIFDESGGQRWETVKMTEESNILKWY